MSSYTREQFIELIKPLAISAMHESKIPASLIISQAILESNNGNSSLAVEGKNLFGIKGKGTEGSITKLTTEYVNGETITIYSDFRKYRNWAESVNDYVRLIVGGVSWNRKLYHGAINTDGITAAYEVAKAGYATDPFYAEKLIGLMNDYNLLSYDVIQNEEKDALLNEDLHKRVILLENRLKEIPAPTWFLKEFPGAINLLNEKVGTYDFWRAYAAAIRYIKNV